jgi:hypothetical protein
MLKDVSMGAVITEDVQARTSLKPFVVVSTDKKITWLPGIIIMIHKLDFNLMRWFSHQQKPEWLIIEVYRDCNIMSQKNLIIHNLKRYLRASGNMTSLIVLYNTSSALYPCMYSRMGLHYA